MLEIRLFGQISVQRSGERLAGLPVKALELLSFLLLHRERGHSREGLAGRFWPDAPDTLARKYLRQAIWRLQSALVSQELLVVHSSWVRVNPEAAVWLDVAEFERVYEFHRDTPGREFTDSQAQALEAAVALYRGDLIEAWYQDWCVYERDRLQLIYLSMLEQLMFHCEAQRYYPRGVAYGQHILRYDPARESTHRQLMRLYYHAGDRTTALRQFDRCTVAMAKQFSVNPSRETVALYHQVRGDRLDSSTRQVNSGARATGEAGSDLLLQLQTSLDRIQVSLTVLQHQVRQALSDNGLGDNGRYPGMAGRQEAR